MKMLGLGNLDQVAESLSKGLAEHNRQLERIADALEKNGGSLQSVARVLAVVEVMIGPKLVEAMEAIHQCIESDVDQEGKPLATLNVKVSGDPAAPAVDVQGRIHTT
jgi:hypothetical protein